MPDDDPTPEFFGGFLSASSLESWSLLKILWWLIDKLTDGVSLIFQCPMNALFGPAAPREDFPD